MTARFTTFAACCAAGALALAIAGCAQTPTPGQSGAPAPAVEQTAAPSGQVQQSQASGGVTEMANAKKRTGIHDAFPVEFPVIAGEVVSGGAVTTSELQYELLVPHPRAAVERWYRALMMGRAFTLKGERAIDDGIVIAYFRGNMEYTIRILSKDATTTTVQGRIRNGGAGEGAAPESESP